MRCAFMPGAASSPRSVLEYLGRVEAGLGEEPKQRALHLCALLLARLLGRARHRTPPQLDEAIRAADQHHRAAVAARRRQRRRDELRRPPPREAIPSRRRRSQRVAHSESVRVRGGQCFELLPHKYVLLAPVHAKQPHARRRSAAGVLEQDARNLQQRRDAGATADEADVLPAANDRRVAVHDPLGLESRMHHGALLEAAQPRTDAAARPRLICLDNQVDRALGGWMRDRRVALLEALGPAGLVRALGM
mmetsp:Transcript_20770/g.70293  ORF Transcript_20770/g.70293 Transcript_20770/m.70293 type:complete len:249 (-) Transcript_20770:249-995(-)